jgi:hypothetical protein
MPRSSSGEPTKNAGLKRVRVVVVQGGGTPAQMSLAT